VLYLVARSLTDRVPGAAVGLCKFVVNRLSSYRSLRADRLRADASVCQALATATLGDVHGSLAINDYVIDNFASSPDDDLRAAVAWAMVNKGFDLESLERRDEAIAVYQRVTEFVPFEPPFTPAVAQGLMNWALALDLFGRQSEEMAIYDRIASNLDATSVDDPVVHLLAWSLLNKAITLAERHLFDESARLCDTVLGRWWSVPDHRLSPKMREAVAAALRHRAIAMAGLSEYDVAIADVDRLLDRYLGAAETGVSEEVAWAMVVKAGSLEQLGRIADAKQTFDDLVARYGRSRAEQVRAAVAAARRLRESIE